jgi:ketosteroid isomerase-like protein
LPALANVDAVQKEVIAATAAWAEAFNARDAQQIAALYADDAVFWGTISPTIRTRRMLSP